MASVFVSLVFAGYVVIDLQLSVLFCRGVMQEADSTRQSELADVTIGGGAGAERWN